ncbi:MAG: hypothetical protein KBC00_01275 [Candidatus Levybacteria bacterium]|nr:hypothetical protein [Candidatus Levybacteria bacterium]MBP9814967.1 hypothetical protein [Candidatus Levybacteria bacterium]
MSLQEVFYIVGLVYMSLGIVLLIALVIVAFYIKGRIDAIHKTFDQKLHIIEKLTSRPAESAADFGASLAEAAIDRVRSAFEGNKKKKSS